MANNDSCTYKEGALPSCAPLAVPMVPPQQSSQPAYESAEALAKGTLFPGLDLPFMDYVATGAAENTPQAELMALDFVLQELALYLDTHPEDSEAFKTWKSFVALAEQGRKRYVELYGPVMRRDTVNYDSWVWPEDPWPWENGGKAVKNYCLYMKKSCNILSALKILTPPWQSLLLHNTEARTASWGRLCAI